MNGKIGSTREERFSRQTRYPGIEFIRIHVTEKKKNLNERSEGATRNRSGVLHEPGSSVRTCAVALQRALYHSRKEENPTGEKERWRI